MTVATEKETSLVVIGSLLQELLVNTLLFLKEVFLLLNTKLI